MLEPLIVPKRLLSVFWAWLDRFNEAMETTEVDLLERRIARLEARVEALSRELGNPSLQAEIGPHD